MNTTVNTYLNPQLHQPPFHVYIANRNNQPTLTLYLIFCTKVYVNFLDCDATLGTPLFDNTEELGRIGC